VDINHKELPVGKGAFLLQGDTCANTRVEIMQSMLNSNGHEYQNITKITEPYNVQGTGATLCNYLDSLGTTPTPMCQLAEDSEG